MQRLVLDTQVWLDWLVFHDPGVQALRKAVEEGRAGIWIDAACVAELARVLAYDLGRHTLAPDAQAAALAQARSIARRIESTLTDEQKKSLPRCRDADDQIFLEAALAARADILVTKDRELLKLSRRKLAFRIAAPNCVPST
ncbi:MAG TPA: putative toxin-antitoxin system toxin component, PIN family [Burkholderiales bacterium]|nr:putative toxin-antitoxin system toxin component, PIN family [Burkholderiales bacterium]